MSILILNGSPNGRAGNCEVLIQKLILKMKQQQPDWKKKDQVQVVHLSNCEWTVKAKKQLFSKLNKARGFIFVTGTYWDSWGSPLQVFLENVTDLEGTSAFLGKPAVVLVLNHSVGGKGVLSRLQGVLSTLGCLIPPMSGMVYSWVNEQVLKQKKTSVSYEDLWSLDDLEVIFDHLKKALQIQVEWQGWSVDRKNYRRTWLGRR